MKKVLIGILITIMMAATVNASSLIGYWPLDGNANDATVNNNHGIIHGAPQFVPGKVGQAVKFDGKSGIEIPNQSFFATPNPSAVTFWAKIPYGVRPDGVAVGKKDYTLSTGPTNRGLGWGLDGNGGHRDGFLILLGYDATGERLVLGQGNANFAYDTHNDGKWRHFALSIDADGNATYYVDGVSMNLPTDNRASGFTLARVGNDTPLSFGFSASFPRGGRNWKGYLDEVRFYDGALSQSEILALIAADGGTCATREAGDIDGDCEFNLYDFVLLASEWLLDCTYPNCF